MFYEPVPITSNAEEEIFIGLSKSRFTQQFCLSIYYSEACLAPTKAVQSTFRAIIKNAHSAGISHSRHCKINTFIVFSAYYEIIMCQLRLGIMFSSHFTDCLISDYSEIILHSLTPYGKHHLIATDCILRI